MDASHGFKYDIGEAAMNSQKIESEFLRISRILNRQHNKNQGIELLGRYIKSRFGADVLFYDFKVDKNQAVVNKVSNDHESSGTPMPIERPLEDYRNPLLLKGKEEIDPYFGDSRRIFLMTGVYAIPVVTRGEFNNLLLLYVTGEKEISLEVQAIGKYAAKELVAFLSRVKKSNQFWERMIFRTNYLENILLFQNSEADLDKIMKEIVENIPKAIDMKKCSIALLDKEKEYLLPYYSNFLKHNPGLKYPMDKGLTKDHTGILAMEKKEPIIVYDTRKDPRCDPELAKELNVYSNVTLPILNLQGEPLGVMYVDNEQYEIFTTEQIQFLKIIGKHIGLILTNLDYIDRLHSEVRTDGLTGLYNRESFWILFQEYQKTLKKTKASFALLMLDIDDFKKINDTYGHVLGDCFIKAIGASMEESLRGEDLVGRYGGEEFIILLKDIDEEGAFRIGERIRKNIETIRIQGISTTISIGIAIYPEDSKIGENLLKVADKNLYRAKIEGKNRIVPGYIDKM